MEDKTARKPVVLHLTADEAKMLVAAVSRHWDRGPSGEGWQSAELSRLSARVDVEVREGMMLDIGELPPLPEPDLCLPLERFTAEQMRAYAKESAIRETQESWSAGWDLGWDDGYDQGVEWAAGVCDNFQSSETYDPEMSLEESAARQCAANIRRWHAEEKAEEAASAAREASKK